MEEFIQADDFDSVAVELMKPPDKYEYTKEEFLDPAPYEQLYRFIQMPFVFQGEVDKMAARAKQGSPILTRTSRCGFPLTESP